MELEPGRSVLHYRIVEKLGQGGMGVVWKAVDTTLDRAVAIKVLPDVFAGDADRLARFEQEARLLAAVNHPNIAAVYSVHQHEGLRFLAMEMVEGADLSQRLLRGPLPLDEALKIAVQVAEALETAHDRGVIHRDLKPANIQITPAGKVKVLDFGLAKALASAAASSDPGLSPTMTSAGTIAGMILGTAGYMSPEQARGREVDRRADVWAFGAVLYEMLTGRRAFEGDTVSDTLASVLKIDPDWETLPADTPPAVRRVVRRCLTRDLDRRLGHVSGARIVLQETLDGADRLEGPAEPPVAATVPAWRRALPWALAALLALVAAGALWRASSRPVEDRPTLTLSAQFPDGQRLSNDQMGLLALSPDGRTLAASLEGEDRVTRLWVRRLDEPAFRVLAGTEDAKSPLFSPDGRWIAFFADNKLKKIAVDGGKPITLCDSEGDNRGATWGVDDVIVFAPHYTQGLSRVAGSGGEPTTLTTVDVDGGERTHRWPTSVPGEDLVIFTVGTMDSPENYDGSRIDAIRPSTGERKTILSGASLARYLPTGHLLFGREGFLFAVPFDVKSLEVKGNPAPVVENVMGMRSSGVVYAEFARTGLLAYIAGMPTTRQSRLVIRHRDGRSEPLAAPIGGYTGPRLSPDGKRLAVAVEGGSTFDVWTYDLERETLTRLTFEGDNTLPVWSPDGKRIAFASVRNDALMSVYVKAADGSGSDEQYYVGGDPAWGNVNATDWSPDGDSLFVDFANKNQQNMLRLDLASGDEEILLETPSAEQGAVVSPDGRWVAYFSDEAGGTNVYARRASGSGGKWQISSDGGVTPRWSKDGKRLYYRSRDQLFEVTVDASGDVIRAGRSQPVLDGLGTVTLDGDFAVLDDDRFLVVENARNENAPQSVTVVVNWFDELRRRLGH